MSPERRSMRRRRENERTEVEPDPVIVPAIPSAESSNLKADIDELLDEIDEILEDNAADFVRNYIQKGGE